METIASDTFGKPVKLTHQKVFDTLTNPYEGMAHVFVHDPKLISISRIKNGKEWEIAVEESWDDDPESDRMPLTAVYYVTFKDENLDAAIKLFFDLIKSPRKDYEESMRRKIGKYIIFPNPKSSIQICLYEILRSGSKRSASRGRQFVARKGKKINRHCKETWG
jgi:hypothetical protein